MLKRLNPRYSIRRKMLLMLMLVALCAAFMTAGVLSAYEFRSARKNNHENLTALMQILAPNLTAALAFDDSETAHELILPLVHRHNINSATVVSNNGQLFAQVKKKRPIEQNKDSLELFSQPLLLDGISYGHLIISANSSLLESRINFYSLFLGVLLTLTLVVSLLLSLFLRQRFIKPILHLAEIADKVTRSHNYGLRATCYSQDEIGQLTDDFNSMLTTIEHRENLLEGLVQERTQELKQVNSKLHQQAYNDSLSDLPNRLSFHEHLQTLLTQHQTEPLSFALLFIDLDGFKEVNDTLGHDVGDQLLQQAGQRLRHSVRPSDLVARLGGDEFTIIVKNNTQRLNAIASTILQKIEKPFEIGNETIFVTASIGITLFPNDGNNVDTLMKHADQAMYESKRKGRNCYQHYTPKLEEKAQQRRVLVDDLRTAIQQQQFDVYYQPIVNLATDQIVKAEALIRWHHPTRGLVTPTEFVTIAEEVGLINAISEQLISQATRTLARWQLLLNHSFQMSVNASPLQLQGDTAWIARWYKQIEQLKIKQPSITIEITENLLMEASESVRQTFTELHNNGIRVAIDDFGVGHSSLAYLQQMDIDIIKIDRSFTQNIAENSDSLSLCKAMITMAHQLDLIVIAEGIETEAQKQLLIEAGCDLGQGYLFAKPLPASEFEALCFNHQPKPHYESCNH